MADTLSQEEIDALREAVKTGTAFEGSDEQKQGTEPEQIKIVSYDFRKPQILSPDQLHSVQIMHETFGKALQTNLFSLLKSSVEIKLVAVDQISYGEFVLSLSNPTYLINLATKPNIGNIGLEINASVVLAMLEILLGSGNANASKGRDLTYLERSIFRNVSESILADLNSSWSNVAEISMEIADEESNPEYLQLTTAETPCLCIAFDVHIGATTGLLNFCYPFVVIQSAVARGEASGGKKKKAAGVGGDEGEMILKALDVVPLNVRAAVGSTIISAQELGWLKVGDVVCLEQRIDNPISIYVGENRAFTAEIGKYQGKVAVGLVNACGMSNAPGISEKKAINGSISK